MSGNLDLRVGSSYAGLTTENEMFVLAPTYLLPYVDAAQIAGASQSPGVLDDRRWNLSSKRDCVQKT
jgi:hypothetical protein